jgi:hypothetical protein
MESNRLVIVDDFIDYVDEIRQYALHDIYYPPTINDNWVGFRSKKYKDLKFCQQIKKLLNQNYYGNKKFEFEGLFCYCPKISQDLAGSYYDRYKLHTDKTSQYAGIFYLNLNPPKHTGTIVGKNVVENVYNRLIMFDSTKMHGPDNFYGDNIEDSRLLFVFFSWTKLTLPFSSNKNIFNL